MASKLKESIAEAAENIVGPHTQEGFQENLDKYEFYNMQQHEVEEEKRADPDNINYFYCLVFQATEKEPSGLVNKIKGLCMEIPVVTLDELTKTRHEILDKIEQAGFVTQSVYSSNRDLVIVKIGCNDARLLREAELKEYMLELNPFSLQHVLELKVKDDEPDAVVTKPTQPVFVGYDRYTEEEFARILKITGEGTLALFRNRDGNTGSLTDEPISLSVARKTFLDQCKRDPFKHIHFKYDADWEKQIVEEHKVQLYRVYRDGTILRTTDRIALLSIALARDDSATGGFRGGGLNIDNLIYQEKIKAAFPLEFNDQIRKAKDIDSDEIYDKFKVPVCGGCRMYLPFKQPVQDIRDYCGEKIAYYFAFLEFYSQFLVFSALIGLCFFIAQLVNLNEQIGSADILNPILISEPLNISGFPEIGERQPDPDAVLSFLLEQNEFVTERTPFAISIGGDFVTFMLTPSEIRVTIVLYAVIIALWGSFFIEFWKRRERTLAFKWGVSDFEKTAEVRPEFKSEFDVPDAVTGLPTPYRSVFKFGTKLTLSAVTVLTLVGMTIAAFAATYVFKAVMANSDNIEPTTAVQIALVLNALAIIALGIIFKSLGKKLTDWENHRTDIEYEDQLILKIFIFSFFNSYTTLLYFAFIKSGTNLADQNQYCSADLEDLEIDLEVLRGIEATADFVIDDPVEGFKINFELYDDSAVLNALKAEAELLGDDSFLIFGIFDAEQLFLIDSCYGALGYSLVIIFFSQIVVNNFQEIGIPLLSNFLKRLNNIRAVKNTLKPDLNLLNRNGEAGEEDPEVAPKRRALPLKSPAERQFLLTPYTTPFYDYLELALQFGYVTLFVAAFPLAPLLALLNNFIEVWVDSNKVFQLSRRPNVARAQDIGTWLRVFETLSYISIVTNGAVLVFTSVEIVPISPDREEDRVWFFLGFILFVFTIKYIADLVIADVPWSVSVMLRRQEFYESQIFFDTEDALEKFVVKAEDIEKITLDDPDDEEAKQHFMELAKKFEPLDTDPYMTQIVDEVRRKMNAAGVSKTRLFDRINTNEADDINLKEVKAVLQSSEFGIGGEVEPQIIQLFVNALDLDGDGKISKKELEQFLDESAPEGEPLAEPVEARAPPKEIAPKKIPPVSPTQSVEDIHYSV